jgi:predicted PurR-regulated permease PerM
VQRYYKSWQALGKVLAVPQNNSIAKVRGPWVTLLTIVLVVTILWIAKAILLPLALGLIFAFILTPLVRVFDRMRIPRFAGVTLTLLLALSVVGGVGYVIVDQFLDLSAQVTKYTSSMRKKVSELRLGNDAALRQFTRAVDRVTEQLDENAADQRRAQPVRVVPSRPTPTERLEYVANTVFEPLVSTVIVLALISFLLGQREDLRDRIIRLTGSDNVNMTTRLMDEAAHRVSQYLLAQTLVNIAFGVLVTAGLYWIGVPYAALWGGLAAVLKFVPYVGTVLAVLLPALLAFALFPGWAETVQTIALFAGLDLITAYIAEPVVLGHRTGVSSFALLVSALFWIWVWGPIGLLLATPLTVCIAVLGRHVRSLRFLAIIFADEPALMPHVRYYQRLLARDEDEASTVVERKSAELGAVGVMDQVLIPALSLTLQHQVQKEITDEDASFIIDVTAESIDQLGLESAAPVEGVAPVLGIARTAADQVALDMLQAAVGATGVPMRVVDGRLSFEDALAQVFAAHPPLLCIVALGPGGGAEARKLCRRVRAEGLDIKLLVLRPHLTDADVSQSTVRMKEAGADCVAASVSEVLAGINQLLAAAGEPEVETSPPQDRERPSRAAAI